MNNDVYLLVVSGPSGIGKDTVVSKMMALHPKVQLSVSATTRPPRAYEKNAQHYYFFSQEEFLQKVAKGEFVEHTIYAKNHYGTLKSEVDKRIENKISCVLVIEVNGSANVKQMYPGCTTVFIVAPSMQEHERRLRARGSEGEKDMVQRMQIAQQEMLRAKDYDFVLVNDNADICADELYNILHKRQNREI